MKSFLILASLFLFALGANAATDVSVGGGVSFLNGDAARGFKRASEYYTGEFTTGFGDIIQVGGFFDYNTLHLISSESGSLYFYGGVARIGFEYVSNLFFDVKIGFTQNTAPGYSSDTSFGFGLGAGYDIPLTPIFTLRPRIGYRNLPSNRGIDTAGRNSLDFNLLVSFGI